MSTNSKDTKTPSPEEIEAVFSYLQKVLIAYVKKNYNGEVKETIPVEDESLEESKPQKAEKEDETKDQDKDAKPSTYSRRYYSNGYRRSYNGYSKPYYNGRYAYSGVPRRTGYRRYKDSYNGVPGQVDPEEESNQ
jgi:hypothetical protein